jgi:hypothetical protein
MSQEHEQTPALWLEHEDGLCRPDRAHRLQWTIEAMPQVDFQLFRGGLLSKYLFEESRYCFVYGQFLATILLGLAFIEHTLAALFFGGGRNDLGCAGLATLLSEAVNAGWLSNEEYAKLDNSRAIRNSIAHFRPPLHPERIEYRAFISEENHPYQILESDARDLLEVVFSLFQTSLLSA